MGTKELQYHNSMKYLGVTFTRHLSWTEHVKGRIRKAIQTLNLTKAIIGQTWGMNPEKVLWIYTALIRPIISYGCLVWAKSLTKSMLRGLKRVQRQALLSMASPLRSTPTSGMEAAIGLTPLDLFVQAEAMKARIRSRQMANCTWDGLGTKAGYKGHQRHWDDVLSAICPLNFPIDNIPRRYNWEVNACAVEHPDLMISSDERLDGRAVGQGRLDSLSW